MSFGLKNRGTTYQRLMDKVLKGQIGRNVEVYIDDKWESCDQHVKDLEEVFGALRMTGMRLNLEKCVFRVGDNFLGFMLMYREMEANLDKCQVIIEMWSPKCIKEVQILVGRLMTLSRFMLKMAEKTKSIIILLKSAMFQWDNHCTTVFA